MSRRASFSLGRALRDAAAFLPAAWGGAWLSLILFWAVDSFAPIYLLKAAHWPLEHVALLVAAGAAKLVLVAALYRIALFGKAARKEGLGLGGVQFGLPEVRLLGAGIVVGLFMLMIAATLAIVFFIAFNLSGMGDGYRNTLEAVRAVCHRQTGYADWLFIGYGVASALLLVFLAVKFALFHAATVAERRMVTLNALGLSSGNAGRLFTGLCVVALPVVLAAAVFHLMHRHFVLSPRAPAFDTPHMPHLILHGILLAVAAVLVLPLAAGFLSSAYRQVVAERAGALND